jgi:hypothetical protein
MTYSSQEQHGLKYPELIPPKAVQWREAPSTATHPSISTLSRSRDTRKSLNEGSAPELEIRGKSPEQSLN